MHTPVPDPREYDETPDARQPPVPLDQQPETVPVQEPLTPATLQQRDGPSGQASFD